VVTRTKLCSVGLLLALVLLGHGLILSWLYEKRLQLKPLVPMAEPMLTRIIKPAPSPVPVIRSKSRHARRTLASAVTALPQADATALPGVATDQSSPDVTDQQGASGPEQSEPAPPALAPPPPVLADEASTRDGWPLDTRLSYDLKGYYRGDLQGSAGVQWQREQSRYQVRLDMSMALVVRLSMTSQGEVGPGRLLPNIYEEQFPWSVRRMVFEGGWVRFDSGVQLPQPPNTQDTVSQFVELSHRFSSGSEVLKVGGEVKLWLARPEGIALWTYDVVEEEVLQTPALGAVPAFHLRPRPIANPSGVISAEMWFAPSLHYLPVRVRISLGNGNFVDLLVEKIEQSMAPADPQGVWRDAP
jgi:hypothetical protein